MGNNLTPLELLREGISGKTFVLFGQLATQAKASIDLFNSISGPASCRKTGKPTNWPSRRLAAYPDKWLLVVRVDIGANRSSSASKSAIDSRDRGMSPRNAVPAGKPATQLWRRMPKNAPVMMQFMTPKELLAAINDEISRLEHVKRLLFGEAGTTARIAQRGGPATAFSFGANKPRKKRVLSAAAKARIRAAQKKRWAAWHKAHAKK